MQPTPEQSRGMRSAIATQCFGCVAYVAFSFSQILVYLRDLQIDTSKAVFYVSIPALFEFLRVPLAHYADRLGKKRVGATGLVLSVPGFGMLAMAASMPAAFVGPTVVSGIILYSIGLAMMSSSWYGLLSAVIPASRRGRFFGTLRFSWLTVGSVFAFFYAYLLNRDPSLRTHQFVLGLMTVGLAIRVYFYLRIPELEKPPPTPGGFMSNLIRVMRTPRYMPFCSYVFLLSFFVSSCPVLFALVERETLCLANSQVVWLGNAIMIGSILGYLASGRIVDRYGTKPVFLFCHAVYGIAIFMFVFRIGTTSMLLIYIVATSFLFGLTHAASSVAMTAELLALMPEENKSMAGSLGLTARRGGLALSGVLCAWVLKTDMLSESWHLAGRELSLYDSLLLGFGVMVVMLVVTLGLVPSVLGKRDHGGSEVSN